LVLSKSFAMLQPERENHMRLLVAAAFAVAAPLPVLAQTAPTPAVQTPIPVIVVVGNGRAERPADYAQLTFNLRGEGATGAEAMAALSTLRAKIEASLAGLPGKPKVEPRANGLGVREVRGKACENRNYGMPTLSAGDCAVVGNVATLNFQTKISPAKRVGDAASLIAQLGGSEVNINGGGIDDDQTLQDDAMRDAIADARRQAQLIAQASGVKLGPIGRIQDSQAVASPILAYAGSAPPPPPPPPPPSAAAEPLAVRFALEPPPISRAARVTVTYQIDRDADH
jgi:uncharacterized protein YggE